MQKHAECFVTLDLKRFTKHPKFFSLVYWCVRVSSILVLLAPFDQHVNCASQVKCSAMDILPYIHHPPPLFPSVPAHPESHNWRKKRWGKRLLDVKRFCVVHCSLWIVGCALCRKGKATPPKRWVNTNSPLTFYVADYWGCYITVENVKYSVTVLLYDFLLRVSKNVSDLCIRQWWSTWSRSTKIYNKLDISILILGTLLISYRQKYF